MGRFREQIDRLQIRRHEALRPSLMLKFRSELSRLIVVVVIVVVVLITPSSLIWSRSVFKDACKRHALLKQACACT